MPPAANTRVGDQLAQIIEIGLDARERRLRRAPRRSARERLGAIRAGDDDLGDQRIVERRDLRAVLDPGLDARVGGKARAVSSPLEGRNWRCRILGIEAHLDRCAAPARRLERESLAAPPAGSSTRPDRRR